MKRSVLLALLFVSGALSMAVAAYQQPAAPAGPRVIDIQKLKDDLYVLTSSTPGDAAAFSGGNVAVFITDAGVTLVDTKLAGWGQAVLDKVKSVTNKAVTRIINTHTHGDHIESYRLCRRAHSERGWSPWDDQASIPRSCESGRSAWCKSTRLTTRRNGPRSGRWLRSWAAALRRCGDGCGKPSAITGSEPD
jgi:Metallo-beta-lactamase superfamily